MSVHNNYRHWDYEVIKEINPLRNNPESCISCVIFLSAIRIFDHEQKKSWILCSDAILCLHFFPYVQYESAQLLTWQWCSWWITLWFSGFHPSNRWKEWGSYNPKIQKEICILGWRLEIQLVICILDFGKLDRTLDISSHLKALPESVRKGP